MSHVVLLGDSVFDNAAYVDGGPDVIAQVRQRLPSGGRATLAAVNGSVLADIPRQIEAMPRDAMHLVISIGGNDALGYSAVLEAPSQSVADALLQLADIAGAFRRDYRAMLQTVHRRGLPAAVCAIYDPRYPDSRQRRVGSTGLCVINDTIFREAAAFGVAIIDLRLLCGDDADFATPIEPSVQGGWKIAGAIASAVAEHDFRRGRSEIFIR